MDSIRRGPAMPLPRPCGFDRSWSVSWREPGRPPRFPRLCRTPHGTTSATGVSRRRSSERAGLSPLTSARYRRRTGSSSVDRGRAGSSSVDRRTSGLVQCRSEDGAPLEAAPGWCSLSHLCAYLARELEWKSAGSSLREVRVRVPYASPGGVRRRLSDPRGVVNDTHACAPQVVSLGDTEVRGFPSTFRVSPGPFVQR